jgi:D-glycero-D-manno-heptose 1,7-bisphosphate phosphatase
MTGLRAGSTVFLDRDGTINARPAAGAYITSPAELVLLPGAAAAIASLNAAGLRTVLVTNQRWLSGPAADPAGYAAIHARLERLLVDQDAWLDAAYHCPHSAACRDCRKPAPGMLLQAARDHQVELSKAVMIGDSDTDLQAGRSAGTATILLRADGHRAPAGNADAVVRDLPAAVRLILRELASGSSHAAPPGLGGGAAPGLGASL